MPNIYDTILVNLNAGKQAVPTATLPAQNASAPIAPAENKLPTDPYESLLPIMHDLVVNGKQDEAGYKSIKVPNQEVAKAIASEIGQAAAETDIDGEVKYYPNMDGSVQIFWKAAADRAAKPFVPKYGPDISFMRGEKPEKPYTPDLDIYSRLAQRSQDRAYQLQLQNAAPKTEEEFIARTDKNSTAEGIFLRNPAGRALGQAYLNNIDMITGLEALGLKLVGEHGLAMQKVQEHQDANIQQQAVTAPSDTGVVDAIKSGDIGNIAGEGAKAFIKNAPVLAAFTLTSLGAGPAGVFALSSAMGAGGQYNTMIDMNAESINAPEKALIGGVAQGLLDTVGFGEILKSTGLSNTITRGVLREIETNPGLKQMAWRFLKATTVEEATEISQNIINNGVAIWADKNKELLSKEGLSELFSPSNLKAYAETGLATLASMGPTVGAGTVASNIADKATIKDFSGTQFEKPLAQDTKGKPIYGFTPEGQAIYDPAAPGVASTPNPFDPTMGYESVDVAAEQLGAAEGGTEFWKLGNTRTLADEIADPEIKDVTPENYKTKLAEAGLPENTDPKEVVVFGRFRQLETADNYKRDVIMVAKGANATTVSHEVFHRNWSRLTPEQQSTIIQGLESYEKANGKLSNETGIQERLTSLAVAMTVNDKIYKKMGYKLKQLRTIADKIKDYLYAIVGQARALRKQIREGKVDQAWLQSVRDVMYATASPKLKGVTKGNPGKFLDVLNSRLDSKLDGWIGKFATGELVQPVEGQNLSQARKALPAGVAAKQPALLEAGEQSDMKPLPAAKEAKQLPAGVAAKQLPSAERKLLTEGKGGVTVDRKVFHGKLTEAQWKLREEKKAKKERELAKQAKAKSEKKKAAKEAKRQRKLAKMRNIVARYVAGEDISVDQLDEAAEYTDSITKSQAQKGSKLGDMTPIGALGTTEYSLYAPKWEINYDTEVMGTVNNRLKNELVMHESLFGPIDGTEVRYGRGTGKKQERVKTASPHVLLEDLYKRIEAGDFKELLDRSIPVDELIKRRNIPPDRAAAFKLNVEDLRAGSLFLDDDAKGRPLLGDNGKAGMSADFLLATCHPTTPCKECYAAKAYWRPSHVRKAYRNTVHILIDPDGWAKRVAKEVKKVKKTEMPFVRMLGSGDLTSTEMIRGFNKLSEYSDRPIHVFSRHHRNLAKLKGTRTAPFIKMGSIDGDLYNFYGPKFLSENLNKRGISNAFLLSDESDIPKIKKLFNADALGLVLAANVKLHNMLPDNIKPKSCPCDADERSYFNSCKQCALSEAGCFMCHSLNGIDENGKIWNLTDPRAPADITPVTRWFDKKLEAEAYSKILVRIIEKSIDLTSIPVGDFKDGNRNNIPLKDIRWPDDTIYVKTLEAVETWKANMRGIIEDVKKGNIFLPGGEIQPAVAFESGQRITDPEQIKMKGIAARQAVVDATPATTEYSMSIMQDIKETVIKEGGRARDKLIAPISTVLEKMHPSLKRSLRKFEYDYRQSRTADTRAVAPFMEKFSRLSKDVQGKLDLALKNADITKINDLVNKHNLNTEWTAVQRVLENLHQKAKDVGIDLGYIENYFPRVVDDLVGLRTYLKGTDQWSLIESEVKKEEARKGTMTQEERNEFISTLLRGYGRNNISLTSNNVKTRLINNLTPEMNEYYQDAMTGLYIYTMRMNEAIEGRRFFGKGLTELSPDAYGPERAYALDDPIASYVDEVTRNYKIKPEDEIRLQKILQARFSSQSPEGFWKAYRNFEYAETMGSAITAITQLDDLGLAWYRGGVATGLLKAVINATRAGFNASEVTMAQLGIDEVAVEFIDQGKMNGALKKIFKWSGLHKMDIVGKEALINTIYQEYQNKAASPNKDFMDRLEKIFGDDTSGVIKDLKAGKFTENVRYLLFNELLDHHPISLSEMPQTYLEMQNGKIFYMLKTYMLKRLDVFRRESLHKIAHGATIAERIDGVKRLAMLSFCLILGGMGTDQLKDWLLGRKTSLEDRVIDNVAKSVGLSKYVVYNARQQGPSRAALSLIAPPFRMLDSVFFDAADVLTGKWKGSRLVQSVPLGGKFYYWWLGRGSKMSALSDREITIDKAAQLLSSGQTGKANRLIADFNQKYPNSMVTLKTVRDKSKKDKKPTTEYERKARMYPADMRGYFLKGVKKNAG